MLKHGIVVFCIVFFMSMISGCRHVECLHCDACSFCMMANTRVPKINIAEGVSLSSAIDVAINAMGVERAQRISFVIQMPDDGSEPTVKGFSAHDITAKDAFKLICDTCNYCYVINSDGVIFFVPKFVECVFPQVSDH